jgi:hypothetical protein
MRYFKLLHYCDSIDDEGDMAVRMSGMAKAM